MNDERSNRWTGFCGREGVAGVYLVTRKHMEPPAFFSAMEKICKNRLTIWRNLDRSWYQTRWIYADLDLPELIAGFSGCYVVDPKSQFESGEGQPRILFFVLKPEYDPFDALIEADRALLGNWPPAVPAALMEVLLAFKKGHATISEAPAIFAATAECWPFRGIRLLAFEQNEDRMCLTNKKDRMTEPALKSVTPEGGGDQAPFLLVLREAIWRFETRKAIGLSHYQIAEQRSASSPGSTYRPIGNPIS